MACNKNCKKVKLQLRKGDSSDFFYTCKIKLNINGTLEGWKAYTQIGDVLKSWEDITSKELELVLTSEDTQKLKVHDYECFIKFLTNDGKVGTSKQSYIVSITEEMVDVR